MLSLAEQGKQLRIFLESKFPTMADAARALKKSPQNLNAYLSGRQRAGPKMRKDLEALGMDLVLLDHGFGKADLDKRFSAMVQRVNQQAFTEEEKEIVAILRMVGVTNRVDFHLYFDYARAVQDKVDRDKERAHRDAPQRRAAEGMAPYNKKKGTKK